LRLCYEKLGRAAFGSHLDLVRLLPRLFRRLSLPLYYSLGFNPKPVMVFGPALSLGVLSLSEYVDIKLAAKLEDVDCDALPELLSNSSIDGVRFVAARALGAQDPKLSRVIDYAEYAIALPRAALDLLGLRDADELARFVAERRHGPLVVRRNIDGVGKRVDVAQYLEMVRVGEGATQLARAGLVGELIPVAIGLRITQSGTAKAGEALEALLGRADVPARIVRSALGCNRNGALTSPLELDALRGALVVATDVAVTPAKEPALVAG
jgi:radical SAM-linked protein